MKMLAEQEILRRYRRRLALEWFLAIPATAGAILVGLSGAPRNTIFPGHGWQLVAGLGLFIGAFILHFMNWRCPCCGAGLSRGQGKCCRDCGAVLKR